ncbi:MAG: hypothetical protein QXX68_00555 [Candidatus Pacearchaeota archaeon]
MKKKKGVKIEKEEKNYIKKPFLLGFVASLVILALFLFYLIFSLFKTMPKVLSSLIILFYLCYLVTLASFFYLGKKHNSKLIKNTSIILAVFSILFLFLFFLISLTTVQKLSQNKVALGVIERISSGIHSDLTEEEAIVIISYFVPIFLYLVFSYLVFAILSTILSVKIFQLEEVKYCKFFSITNIIYVWLPITIIGFLFIIPVYMAVLIIQSLMFYELAKQNKEIKNG